MNTFYIAMIVVSVISFTLGLFTLLYYSVKHRAEREQIFTVKNSKGTKVQNITIRK